MIFPLSSRHQYFKIYTAKVTGSKSTFKVCPFTSKDVSCGIIANGFSIVLSLSMPVEESLIQRAPDRTSFFFNPLKIKDKDCFFA